MRFAYADPPYIGQAKRHYSDDPKCAEVDHAELLARLRTYDGWALSCSTPSLKHILSLRECPDDIHIGSWVKPFASWKPDVNPAYAWEPVIFWGWDGSAAETSQRYGTGYLPTSPSSAEWRGRSRPMCVTGYLKCSAWNRATTLTICIRVRELYRSHGTVGERVIGRVLCNFL